MSSTSKNKMSQESAPPGAPPPPSTLTTPVDPPADTLNHFRSIPWANALLSSYTSSADYYPIQTWSRIPKPATGEDGFFAGTLATNTTIPHVLTLRRRHIDPPPRQPPELPSSTKKPATPATPSHPPDLLMLLVLSNPGISGHPSTAHGGAVATILDEALSLAVALHVPVSPCHGGRAHEAEGDARGKIYTAQLDVRYRKPVAVPGVVVVRAWCVARDGRKYWMRGQVVQEEEGEETVKVDALGFWVETAAKL